MTQRVSIDFDGTLSMEHVQDYAEELIERKIEIWIVTSRSHFDWHDVIDVADKLKIPHRRIIFTGGESKVKALNDLKPIWHLDDDWQDLTRIASTTKTVAISVFGNMSWRAKCNRILKKHV